MSAVVIRWLSSADRAVVREVWAELERRVPNTALACSWVWTGTWLRHYGDVVPHQFAIGERAGEPCGVALVTRGVGGRRGPFRVRSVHLGTAGEPGAEGVFVEYNGTLVEPGQREAFASALMQEIRRDRAWHVLQLDGFEPNAAEPLLAAEPLFDSTRVPCPIADLRRAEAAGGSVLATLERGTRRKVRRSLEALGDVATEWAETPEHALDILAELAALHQERWTKVGEPGAFASDRFTAFHRDLVTGLIPGRSVILFRVRATSGTVGCLYHLVDDQRVLFYQSGLTSYADRRIASGFVAFTLCMQACFERGFAEYDFLAPDTRYKRDLSTKTGELVWATARRPALRWRILDGLASLKARTETAA